MIFIYETHVKKDNLSRYFLHSFQISVFGFNSGVEGQKMAENGKKFSVTLHISGHMHHML